MNIKKETLNKGGALEIFIVDKSGNQTKIHSRTGGDGNVAGSEDAIV